MEDKHKRVTKAQVELWLSNPVTQVYLKCLKWAVEDIDDTLKSGAFIDSSNNDSSMNNIHSALGTKDGLIKAQAFEEMLNAREMIEKPKEPNEDE